MSVPGEGAFTNSRARLLSPHVPLKGITGQYPKSKISRAVELPSRFPASDGIADSRRLGDSGQSDITAQKRFSRRLMKCRAKGDGFAGARTYLKAPA
jgi:hypothetical protein